MSGGKSAARREQRQQRTLLAQQNVKEQAKVAEAESEVARKKLLAKQRSSGQTGLIRTSETGISQPQQAGLAQNLGG